MPNDKDILNSSLFEALSGASEQVYMYVSDVSRDISRWSLSAVRYFDMPGEYIEKAGEIWAEKIHPDDRAAYLKDVEDVFSGRTRKHCCQYRAKNRFGEYVWIECKGTMIYDSEGKMSVFAGLMTRLDGQSKFDALTGLLSKNEFYQLDFSEDSGIIILLGVDNFRRIISVYGYDFGDYVLTRIGRNLSDSFGQKHNIYRFNGDEFMIVIKGEGREFALKAFERAREAASKITSKDGRVIGLSFSASSLVFPADEHDTDYIVNCLELTLDYVKKVNKGSMAFYSEEIEAKRRRSSQLKIDLKRSIANNFEGFELYYQPWIDAHGTRILGCEALLRWKGETIKDAGPVEFIPILEESGDIISVGRWVMRQSMKQQREWQDKYGKFMVSFNVSYRQFMENGYVEELAETAGEFGVDPVNMTLELTESSDVETPENLAVIFEKIMEHGFRIALDDFGTGYASMELMKKLPSNSVKIEHNFVRELEKVGHDTDFAIIEAILVLCRRLGCTVVVEGVENKEVDEIIRKMNVNYLQGYYYSKPVCKKEFEELLEKNACAEEVNPEEKTETAKGTGKSLVKLALDALANSYLSIYMLNIADDTFQEYHASDDIHTALGFSGRITGSFEKLAEAALGGEYTDEVLEFLRTDTMEKRLSGKSMVFRDFPVGGGLFRRVSIMPVKHDETGRLSHVILAIQEPEATKLDLISK